MSDDASNRWLVLVVILTDSAPLLPTGELSASLSVRDVVSREEQIGEDVDASVRVFARQARWPKLSAEESFFLNQRLRFGLHIANALATPDKSARVPRPSIFPSPPEEFSLDTQLEWLLIDAWKHEGRRAWQEQFLAQASRK